MEKDYLIHRQGAARKVHKYISRVFKNGRWQYFYKNSYKQKNGAKGGSIGYDDGNKYVMLDKARAATEYGSGLNTGVQIGNRNITNNLPENAPYTEKAAIIAGQRFYMERSKGYFSIGVTTNGRRYKAGKEMVDAFFPNRKKK